MKTKKTILILIMLLFILKSYSQTAYYDALKLKDIFARVPLTDNDVKEAGAILANYVPGSTDQTVHVNLVSNPFLPLVYTGYTFNNAANNITASGILSNNIGATNVTNIVDGISKFIVERTKKELQAAFFDRFVKQIKSKEFKDIQILFPHTYSVILSLPEKVFSYEPYLQSLREAFGKDLTNILPNLEEVLKNGSQSTQAFFNTHKELKSICLTALYFGKQLRKGEHIGEVLEKYNTRSADFDFTTANAETVRENAILFIQEISKSFKTQTPGSKEYWIPAGEIRDFINDGVALKLYLALIYEKVKTLSVAPGDLTYGKVLENLYNNGVGTKIQDYIEKTSSSIESCQELLTEIQKKAEKDRTIDDYIGYFNASLSIIDSFRNNTFIADVSGYLLPANGMKIEYDAFWERYDKFSQGAKASLAIYSAVKEKNYSLAIANVRTLYNMRYNIAGAPPEINRVSSFLLEKGALIAGVAEAKTSEDVYKAIERSAMPEGGSRVKRLSTTNVAVNAYCGLFAGKEKIHNAPEDGKFINSYGLAAPVGFSFSKGDRILPWPIHGIFKAKGFSSSWFVSIIDVGAVAAYRFSNETTEEVPEIQLKDVFAPGLFWSVGLPRLPISINLGAQVGPNLRKVNDTTNDYSGNTYIRYSASICVDIPIVNLFTKSE